MPQPTDGPATLEATKLQLQLEDTVDDTYITSVVDAVNVTVRDMAYPLSITADPAPAEWPADILLGSNMLAARLVRRRNSPSGVEALTDAGAAYVSRNDPDISQLLRIGANAKPMVG